MRRAHDRSELSLLGGVGPIPIHLIQQWYTRQRSLAELSSFLHAYRRISPWAPIPDTVHELEEAVLLA